jgi:tetratricopeptide (TPR) repeat protein
MDILHGPRVLRKRAAPGGETVNIIGESQQPLRYVRVQHLRGDLADALISYGAIRSSNTGELREAVNEAAADEAGYWIAVCQYELERFDSALSSARLYQKTNPAGVWLDSIPFLQALCLARQGQYQAAAETLRQASAGADLSPRDSFLIRRWQSRPDVAPPME